jgi:hypothetical protein
MKTAWDVRTPLKAAVPSVRLLAPRRRGARFVNLCPFAIRLIILIDL